MSARVTISLDDLLMLKADARGFSLSSRQPIASALSGRHHSRLRGRGLEFEELRNYHPGDDVRTIDWRATARLKSPQVRVYTEERERPVLLLVDQRRPMYFGSRRAMKSVAAAEVAALGAWRALDAGDRVGGLVFNESEIAEVRPQRSRNAVLRVLHEIVRFNTALVEEKPKDAIHGLNEILNRTLRLAKHDHLVVLLSDLDGANEETQRLATLLAAHNDVLIIAIYDPLGASLAGAANMTATDGKQVWQIPDRGEFAEAFRRAFEQRLERWRTIFRNLQIPVLPISTAHDPAEQIRALFGFRPEMS